MQIFLDLRPSAILGFAALVTSVLSIGSAYAGTVTINPATDSVNLSEGSSASDLVTITNELGGSIFVDGYGFSTSIVIKGDPSDGITPTLEFSCVSHTILPRGTCAFPIPVGTGSAVGETDRDSGTSVISNIFVEFTPAGGTRTRVFSDQSIYVTVNDPTPEPPELLLLGTGLAGAFGVLWRRLLSK